MGPWCDGDPFQTRETLQSIPEGILVSTYLQYILLLLHKDSVVLN
jgi:hypothetical protein